MASAIVAAAGVSPDLRFGASSFAAFACLGAFAAAAGEERPLPAPPARGLALAPAALVLLFWAKLAARPVLAYQRLRAAPEFHTAAADAASAPAAQDRANPAPPASNAAAEPEHYDPASAAGAVKGIPAPTNSGSIEAVANYFADLPGFDLAALGEPGREKFLHRVNSEMCTCGCKNETIAWCVVNDPKCPTVKGLAQAIYDEVKKGS